MNTIQAPGDGPRAAAGSPMSRADFQAAQERAQKVEQSSGTPLALVAVVLGFGQLYLLRWAKDHVPREQATAFGGAVFVLYIVIVGFLFVRMLRMRAAAAPRCPQCGVSMRDLSQRVALATGKCDRCGGQVIQ
jgi:hypothetical protein